MFFGMVKKMETPGQFSKRFNADVEDFENGWIEKHDILFSQLGLLIFLIGFVALSSLGHFQLGLLTLIFGGWICITQIVKSRGDLAQLLRPRPDYRRIAELEREIFREQQIRPDRRLPLPYQKKIL
jgi:uncharacterized sodium:solute symporter family permease YidK